MIIKYENVVTNLYKGDKICFCMFKGENLIYGARSPYSSETTRILMTNFPQKFVEICRYGDMHPQIVPFINEDPMLVCSIGIEGMPIRGLITNVGIISDVRVYKDNVCQSLFMNTYSGTDTHTYSTSPAVRETTYWRLFFHSNNWYYDWFNDGGGRVTGGSAQANVWYEVEFGNRYIKNLKNGTYFINTSKVTKEFGETYYYLESGRGSDIEQMRSVKAYFKVYDTNGNIVGNIVPTIRKDGTGGFINLVTGAFLTTEGGIFRELLVNPDGTPWQPYT